MALTNSMVKEILTLAGAEADRIPSAAKQIIDGNVDSLQALRERITELEDESRTLKESADKASDVQKELDDLKEKSKELDDLRKRAEQYDKVKKEFEDYKANQAKVESDRIKTEAYKELLTDMKVSEKGIAQILKWQGVDTVEVDEDGKITNAKDLRKAVKEDWGDYIVAESKAGAETPNPPENNAGGSNMTKDEILKIADPVMRQEAIAEHHELFGI